MFRPSRRPLNALATSITAILPQFYPVASLSDPNISLSTLFLNILSLYASLYATNEVSQPQNQQTKKAVAAHEHIYVIG
jgi:hypothetical protein